MPTKTKLPQKEEFTGRDMFRTPRYATELLIPFLKKAGIRKIWECAVGEGNILKPLESAGFVVSGYDVRSTRYTFAKMNFLLDDGLFVPRFDAVVTNPPFSLKKKFAERCAQYVADGNIKAFALLIPADYSGWIIDCMQYGCEKIVPTRRIDYITPNMLSIINDKIVYVRLQEVYGKTEKKLRNYPAHIIDNVRPQVKQWDVLEEVPIELVRSCTSSFHSMWLTWGLNIGKQETYVELTNEMKNNIF